MSEQFTPDLRRVTKTAKVSPSGWERLIELAAENGASISDALSAILEGVEPEFVKRRIELLRITTDNMTSAEKRILRNLDNIDPALIKSLAAKFPQK